MGHCLSVRCLISTSWKEPRLTDSSSRTCACLQYKPRSSRDKDKGKDDAEDSEDEEELERVSVEDAWLFPVVRACARTLFDLRENS